MAFNTGNALGSTDPRDFSDNAENFDNAVNNTASATWTDRFGNSRTSIAGQVGYIGTGTNGAIESYTSGLVLTTYSTIILYSGEFYRPSSDATIPYTTTATTPDVDSNLVAVGDAVLRQDLANSAATFGSELISRSVLQKKSISEVEALTGTINNIVYLDSGGRSGHFAWDASDLSTEVTADTQQGIYIAPSSDATGASGAWVRSFKNGEVNIEWFGAVDGTDSTVAIQAAIDAAPSGGKVIIPVGVYTVSSTLESFKQITIEGLGWHSTLNPDISMEIGAYAVGTLTGSTFTLSEDTRAGTITIGDEIFGAESDSGTTITGLTSGTADTSGAVYSLSQAVRVDSDSPVHLMIGGEDVIRIFPDASEGSSDAYRGYTFRDFRITSESATLRARNGICIDWLTGTGGIPLVQVDRVAIARLGGYSVASNQATQLTIQNSEMNSVSMNTGGDIMRIKNTSIANFVAYQPNIYMNGYSGSGSFVVEESTITSYGGLQFIEIDNADNITINKNFFEDVSGPDSVEAAIDLKNGAVADKFAEATLISNNIFNTLGRDLIMYFDKVLGVTISGNSFSAFTGRSPVFSATENACGIDFRDDNYNGQTTSTDPLVRYQLSLRSFLEQPVVNNGATVDSSGNLTITTALTSLTDSSQLDRGGWWVVGEGIAYGTYMTALVSGVLGDSGSTYSLSQNPGALTARTIYVIPRLFDDRGFGTIGTINYFAIPESGEASTASLYASLPPGYYKRNATEVALFGAVDISGASGSFQLFPTLFRKGFKPNNFSNMVAMGELSDGSPVSVNLRASFNGTITVDSPPTNLAYLSLEGCSFKYFGSTS